MDAMASPEDLVQIEVRSDGDGWWSNTPWWLVSAGLHLVILLVATLVSIERFMAVESPGVMVTMPMAAPRMLEPELPRDLHTRTGLPMDEPSTPSDEPAFWDPTAEVGEKAESADDDDHRQRKGDSYDSKGFIPGDKGRIGTLIGKTPGINDRIGVGGGQGGPGRWGGPYGGRFNRRPPGGGTSAKTPSENAVTAALKWLARHQNADGSWGAANHLNQCVGGKCAGIGDSEYDAGLTGLALLAYLGAGYTHLSRDEFPDPVVPGRTLRFGEVVKNGLKWLMSRQDPEGCIGGRGPKYMYNHAIASLALTEAYGMSATQLFKGPAQQAVDFILAAQNPDRAWRYTKQPGDNDTSVTGWAIMALKSAELSELTVPAREAYDKARKWVDEATQPHGYYRVGYNSVNSGKVFVPGKNESYVHHESMTAVGVLCRIFMSKNSRDPALGGVQLLVADLPECKKDVTDYYYWYYGSLALFQYDGPTGPYWKKWEGAMKEALLPHQKTAKDGCANGSWTSEDERWGFEGGRVYATAINALTLEVYYRYPNVFRGEK